MTFKLYQNKSSILKKNTRYVQGGDTTVLSNVLGWWEKREDVLTDQIDDISFLITSEFEGRPDKLAYLIYGRSDLTWLVLQYNNMIDINEEFIAGVTVTVPSSMRVFSDILTKSIQYQAV